MSLDDDRAAATTFCVPAFTTACPDSGGNVLEADLEKAMSTNGTDGKADTIRIAAGTFVEDGEFEPSMSTSPETYEPTGTDPLTIEGAGTVATILTSGATNNVFIVNLGFPGDSRAITMRDLTIQVPASISKHNGAAIQMAGDVLENVDLVSLNEESDGVAGTIGSNNVFRDGEVRGEAGGSVFEGFRAGSPSGGSLLVEDSTLLGGFWALMTANASSSLTVRRVKVLGTQLYGAIATAGSVTVENSIFTIDDGFALFATSAADPTSITVDHVTFVNSNGTQPAIEIRKTADAGNADVAVANSILRGFGSGYSLERAIGPGIGSISLEVRYSNLPAGGENLNGFVDVGTGNIDADPLLTPDLTLASGSPSIDAGDPEPAGLTADLLGAPRPVDGNGDGVAVRDQGAFEYQPPVPPTNPPGTDATPPQTKLVKGPGKKLAKGIAKFSFKSNETGSTFKCKLDRQKPKPCKSPKRYKHLKPGRHTFRVWATDAAGNEDPTPAKRRFRVPR